LFNVAYKCLRALIYKRFLVTQFNACFALDTLSFSLQQILGLSTLR